MTATFQAWPKTPRLFRDVVVTEKIDGTNAAVIVEEGSPQEAQHGYCAGVFVGGIFYKVGAQSRTRIIVPGDDNFGFAAWVATNAETLAATLGVGVHYGEWWGSGIQRGYGLAKGEKRFSLFNVKRWQDEDLSAVPGLGVVPVLYRGVFSEKAVRYALGDLAGLGSQAAPGFKNPEGIVVFHTAAGQTFKVLIENDEIPKGLA